MNRRVTFTPHIISLAALFVLGNAILIFPVSSADEFSFTGYLLSALAAVIVYFSVSFFWNKININAESRLSLKIIYGLVLSAVGVTALFVGAESFRDFTEFAAKILLPDTPEFYISAIFGFLVIYFSLKPKESILKFSLVSGVMALAVIVFFFVAPMDKYDLRNIYIFRLPRFNEIFDQSKPYFKNLALQGLILPVYFKFAFGQAKTKAGVIGEVTGAVVLGACILTPILLFGVNVSGSLEFPFSSAVSTVTVGRLFTRLDGFAYFVFFVSCLVKITLCIKLCVNGIKEINAFFRK